MRRSPRAWLAGVALLGVVAVAVGGVLALDVGPAPRPAPDASPDEAGPADEAPFPVPDDLAAAGFAPHLAPAPTSVDAAADRPGEELAATDAASAPPPPFDPVAAAAAARAAAERAGVDVRDALARLSGTLGDVDEPAALAAEEVVLAADPSWAPAHAALVRALVDPASSERAALAAGIALARRGKAGELAAILDAVASAPAERAATLSDAAQATPAFGREDALAGYAADAARPEVARRLAVALLDRSRDVRVPLLLAQLAAGSDAVARDAADRTAARDDAKARALASAEDAAPEAYPAR